MASLRRLAITLAGAAERQSLDAALELAELAPVSLALDCETLVAVARTQPEQLRRKSLDGDEGCEHQQGAPDGGVPLE